MKNWKDYLPEVTKEGWYVVVFCLLGILMVCFIGHSINKEGNNIEACIQENIQTRERSVEKFNPTQEERNFAEWFASHYVSGEAVPNIMQGDFAGINAKGMAMYVLREYKKFQKENKQ